MKRCFEILSRILGKGSEAEPEPLYIETLEAIVAPRKLWIVSEEDESYDRIEVAEEEIEEWYDFWAFDGGGVPFLNTYGSFWLERIRNDDGWVYTFKNDEARMTYSISRDDEVTYFEGPRIVCKDPRIKVRLETRECDVKAAQGFLLEVLSAHFLEYSERHRDHFGIIYRVKTMHLDGREALHLLDVQLEEAAELNLRNGRYEHLPFGEDGYEDRVAIPS
jgi:hypothetical protein